MAAVPIRAVKLVQCVGVCIVPVDGVPCAWDMMFSMVPGVLNSAPVECMVVLGVIIVHSGHQIVLLAFVLACV